MKNLAFAFGMLSLAALLAAIWRSDYAWQCGLTALVFGIAAAGFGGASSSKQVEK